ncbi:MAG: tetratricopeptide repeat protein [Acidobacteria bacterium]|nr:tetratricopeptide repeat protein [Acidobacteriota bacterium]
MGARRKGIASPPGGRFGAAAGCLAVLLAACAPDSAPPPRPPGPADSVEFRRHLDHGIELFRRGARRAAEAELRRAADLAPGDPRPHLFLGRNFYAENFFRQAEAEFRRAVELDRDSVEARVGLVLTHEVKGNLSASLRGLEEILDRDPEHPDGLFLRGRLAYRRGDFAAAAADLERAARSRPEDPQIRYQLGLARLKQDRPEEAVTVLREAVRLDPGHLGAQQAFSRALRVLGATAEAEAAEKRFAEAAERRFQEAQGSRARDANLADVRDRAVEAFNSGNLDLALAEFRAIVAARPGDSQAVTYLGSTHLARGERPEARRYLERGLELDPDNAFAWMELGRLAALEGDLGRAEEFLRRAIEANPDFPLPRYFLAGIYRNQDRIRESEQEMAKFLSLRDLAGESPGESTEREYW